MQNEYDSQQKTTLTRVCKKCNETKPLKEFRYKLTRAQAKQQGYAGNVLVTAEGKVCKVCRPKRKPLGRLNIKELMQKASTGDVHPFVAKSRIENMKKTSNALRKRGRIEGWHRLWGTWMESILEPLNEDIKRTQHQLRHSQKTGKHERAEFLATYLGELKRLKNTMQYNQRTHPRAPEFCCWQEYFPMEKTRELREAWANIPEDQRTTLHTLPTMVKYIYKADDKRLFKRPRRTTPAERLAHGGENLPNRLGGSLPPSFNHEGESK